MSASLSTWQPTAVALGRRSGAVTLGPQLGSIDGRATGMLTVTTGAGVGPVVRVESFRARPWRNAARKRIRFGTPRAGGAQSRRTRFVAKPSADAGLTLTGPFADDRQIAT